jgi:hypothetical protein
MNRKELEQCTWDSTPADERRDRKEHRVLPKFGTKAGKRVQLAEAHRRERKLTGNNREIRVFDPSGSTPGTMSPWMPLWALFNDELLQRCAQGREPKMRAPYNRTRRDYKSSIENGTTPKRHHATKKSPAQLQREIDEVLASPSPGFDEAKAERALIEKELAAAEAAMRAFPRGAMNLPPESVRLSPEYRAAKARTDKAFARLRAFNAVYVKRFAKELRAERSKR